MNLDWIEWAILIGLLAPVLGSWWAPITQGQFLELCAWNLMESQATEDNDFAGNQVDPASEATCAPTGQGDWNFLELLDGFLEG